jgi:hypothetical protein
MLFFINIFKALRVCALAGLLYLCYNIILNGEIMQKIVINTCHGNFGISDEAMQLYKILVGIPPQTDLYNWELDRDSPQLVQIVEQLGTRANRRYSKLKIVEIPQDVEWTLCEYDGCEWVAEVHRTWS